MFMISQQNLLINIKPSCEKKKEIKNTVSLSILIRYNISR